MSIGCSIYFTTVSNSWVGTPEFLRELAAWLEVDKFDSLYVYRQAPTGSESRPHPELESEKLLDLREVPVEAAISSQNTDLGHTTVMRFGITRAMDAMFRDVTATLPESLSEGFVPTEARIYNGPWKHYDYNSGEQRSESGCCFILSNNLGYPVELDAYLEAFLKVPSVAGLKRRLEELSGQPWYALIDLT